MSRPLLSWNRQPKVDRQEVHVLRDRHAALPELSAKLIAYGNGRSYGDVCLNEGEAVMLTRRLDKFMQFDAATGRLTCEAGILLDDILALAAPRGWFLPVAPGTRFVTLGGAIANDVHGKNHHQAGAFGHHVRRLCLKRSDGTEIICGPSQSADWFAATIGGLGLTGLIVWAEIQLAPFASEWMVTRTQRFESLEEFWHASTALNSSWPYTVAWIDCLSARPGRTLGLLTCGRPADAQVKTRRRQERSWRIPLDPPFSLVNPMTLRLFNAWYYRRAKTGAEFLAHRLPFLFPLDGIRNWNTMYGPAGFYQYQCVLPPASARPALEEVLARVSASGQGSFLAVLKMFGDMQPVGLLSFTRPGATLALDFPNRGASTLRLFHELDRIVLEAGGAVYPAKDARMPAKVFQAGFPKLDQFVRFVDPGFSSSFWRRVNS